jgi:hypothetical protein
MDEFVITRNASQTPAKPGFLRCWRFAIAVHYDPLRALAAPDPAARRAPVILSGSEESRQRRRNSARILQRAVSAPAA